MDEYYYTVWSDATDWYDNTVWNSSTPLTDAVETGNISLMWAIRKWMMTSLLPVIFLLGVVGHILSIIVFIRGNWYGTEPIYLVTLSITDTTVLVFIMLTMWPTVTFGWYFANSSNIACKIYAFFKYTLPYFSSWIIVCIAIERAIVLFFPEGWNCSRRTAKLSLICFWVFICGLCSHLLFGYSLNEENGYCTFYFKNNYGYKLFFYHIWTWIDLCIKSLLPSVILIVANAAIIWRRRRIARTISEVSGNDRGTGQSSSEFTKIAIALSVVYVITTLPVLVIRLVAYWQIYWNREAIVELNLAFAITALFSYCNNAANFYLYCVSCPPFRRQLSLLIPCRRQGYDTIHVQETRPNPETEIPVTARQPVG